MTSNFRVETLDFVELIQFSSQVFIQDNQGGEETTVVNHIDIFGSPLDSINMKQFQRASLQDSL